MNVLVTGGAGFIGSHTVRTMVARGDRVTVLDDLSTGRRERLADLDGSYRFVAGDLRDPAALTSALDGVTHVLHLAALPSVARSVRDPFASHDVNATGTVRLLEASRAAAVSRIAVASSSSVYGDPPGVKAKHEGLAHRPASPYAASKLATEGYALAWSRSLGLEAVALRYFNVFGPGQDPESEYAAVIPRFITRALRGEPLTIYGDGDQTRDFTYVDNAVAANLLALTAKGAVGEAINVACGEQASLNQLVTRLEELIGRKLEVEHAPPRPGDVRDSLADLTRARDLLGYRPQVPFAEGLRRTYASFAAGPGQ